MIFELEASELVGSINRPRAWPAFRAYGLELTEVLSNLTDWKVNMVIREANWGAFLIAQSVTKEMRLQSYVAQGNLLCYMVCLQRKVRGTACNR